jgi:hypothetical protein
MKSVWILLLVTVACFFAYFFLSSAVPVEKYNAVGGGMTEAQVKAIMGVPDYVRHDTPQTTTYFYGGFGRCKWDNMEVYFESNGRVTGKFDDDF